MTEVIIAIGSNTNQKNNIELADVYIKELFLIRSKLKFQGLSGLSQLASNLICF